VGLLREGFGADAKGGTGTGVLAITSLEDSGPGTLRAAYSNINASNRIVRIDPLSLLGRAARFFGFVSAALSGDIVLKTPIFWKKPYTTLDLSNGDVTITTELPAKEAILVGGTHNVIVFGVRGRGHFPGSDPTWVQKNNSAILSLDGDVPNVKWPWDDQWDAASDTRRRSVHDSIFDRNTLSQCEDDCLAMWEGVHDVSVTRNWVHDSFHPSTTGAKGAPLPAGRERLRIYWAYNVHSRNGERNLVLLRRESYWWVVVRNLVVDWMDYTYKDYAPPFGTGMPAQNWPQGMRISGTAPLEANMGWGIANCAVGIGGTGHKTWGASVDDGGCDNAPVCCAPACTPLSGVNIKCCNPRVQGNGGTTRSNFYFEANEGDMIEWSKTFPAGYVPPALPFSNYDKTRAWSRVIAEVGVPLRNAAEQTELNRILARTTKCVPAVQVEEVNQPMLFEANPRPPEDPNQPDPSERRPPAEDDGRFKDKPPSEDPRQR